MISPPSPRHTVTSLRPVGMTSRAPLLKLNNEPPGDGGGHTHTRPLSKVERNTGQRHKDINQLIWKS